jgi:CHAD domain-containing protein
LLPENSSKYARGIELLKTGQPSQLPVGTDETAKNALPPLLTTLADRCIAELFVMQTAVQAQGATPESIRALRIQCRRLRSLLQFFQPRMRKDAWQLHTDRLRQWGALLGSIRDIDVLNKAWTGFADYFSVVLTASPHWRHILTERREFLAEDLLHRLARSELTALVFELQAWLYREQEAGDETAEAHSNEFIRKSLLQTSKQLREDLDEVDAASGMKKLHKLRIKIKRVRYFQEALTAIPQYQDEDFLAALKLTQTAIGKIHDAYQIKSLLDQIDTGSVDEKFLREKELFLCWRGRQIAEQMFLLPKVMEELDKAAKMRSRALASLRSSKRGKTRHHADSHEPSE